MPQLAIDTEEFITHLPILEEYKTKAGVGSVCTLSRNWQLGA
jgi:hypothetical protein